MAVDIGGTDIKTIMLDEKGDLLSDRLQVKTDPTVLRMIAGLPLPLRWGVSPCAEIPNVPAAMQSRKVDTFTPGR